MLAWLGKPKTWAWIAGSLVILAVGIAGLTGVLLRHELAPLQSTPLVLDNGAHLQVEALHGGWFSTQVTLRMEWPLGNQRQLVLRLANEIGHGPFPLDRLARFDLRPAIWPKPMPIRAMPACWNKPRAGPCSRMRRASEGGGHACLAA
ncbi:MAG TPA: DUF945 family protein [Pseudomonas sp.]|nr:DUF945 family protein [Pseudomonas sp.]